MEIVVKPLLIITFLLLSSVALSKDLPEPSENRGHFQLIKTCDAIWCQLLLNTQTGQMWRYKCIGPTVSNCDEWVWAKESIEGINISRATIDWAIEQYKKKSKKTEPLSDDQINRLIDEQTKSK